MKKIFSFVMMFAAAATAFVACSKEEVIETPNAPVLSGKTKTITVTSATTRTTIEDKQLKWAEDDTYGILFADEAGHIIGSAKSPEYSAETETYTLEAPEETAALYCYYPYEAVSQSEVENAVSAGATSVKYGIVELNIYDGEQEGGQYTYMAANAEVSEENTVDVKFELLAAILELNIYDSSEENPDNSALYNVAIYADKVAGWATLSFADGVKLHTEESDELSTYIRANFNSWNGVEVNVGTKEKPVKVYVPVLKGSYENFDVVVTTENHSVGTKDNRLVINKNNGEELSIDKDYYTVNVDLADGFVPDAGGDKTNGEFTTAEVDKEGGLGDLNAIVTLEKTVANSPVWTGVEYAYELDITGNGSMVFVKFDTWPSDYTDTFDDANATKPSSAEFRGGHLTVYKYGEYWTVFYADAEKEYPYAYLHTIYHSDGTEDPKEDAVFAISSNGAKITKATGTEDWAVAVSNHLVGGGYGDFLDTYWEIQYTADANDKVTFSAIPENYGYNNKRYTRIYTNNGSNWKYSPDFDELWFTFPDGYKVGESNAVNLHGEDSSNTTEYVVVLPENGSYADATYVIHVVLTDSLGDDGGEGGEEPATAAFVIAEDATYANATLKQATGNENWAQVFADWNGGIYREDIKEYWELTITGDDDAVYFSSCPRWSSEEDDDYNPQFFYSNGSSWTFNYANTKEYWTGMWHDTKADGYNSLANILGESWSDASADYIIVFFEVEKGSNGSTYTVPKYALHVVYSSNGGGNDEPAQPADEAFALSSINVIEFSLTKTAGDEAWATFAAGRHSNIKEYWELSAKGAANQAMVALSTCPQWSGTPTIYYASRGSYTANANATSSKNYWTGTWYANNDTMVDLGVAGLADFGDSSLDYIVILGDYALHVLYTIE